MREQVDEAAATSGDGEASEAIGEIVSSGDEVDAPRGEAATRSAANAGSSAMAAASSDGEVNELNDEVARSEVNEMGDTMATASGGGEASEPIGERNEERKKNRRSKGSRPSRKGQRGRRADGSDGAAALG